MKEAREKALKEFAKKYIVRGQTPPYEPEVLRYFFEAGYNAAVNSVVANLKPDLKRHPDGF